MGPNFVTIDGDLCLFRDPQYFGSIGTLERDYYLIKSPLWIASCGERKRGHDKGRKR